MTSRKRSGFGNHRRAYCYPSCIDVPPYNPCDLLPKDTPYQVCSPWPHFGGLDNTNARYTPLLASQTGDMSLLNTSPNLFQASTSPVIARDGTIYIGYNDVIVDNFTIPTQGYLVAFYPDGRKKWTYKLTATNKDVKVIFNTSTPTIGQDGTIYFGSTTSRDEDSGSVFSVETTVYALNPNGILKWKTNVVPTGSITTNNVSITNSLVMGDNQRLYFGCYSDISFLENISSLFSLDAETGTKIMEYPLSDFYIEDSVAIDRSGNIYFNIRENKYTLNYLVYLISLTPDFTLRFSKVDLNNGITSNMNLFGSPVLSVDNSTVYAMTFFYDFKDNVYFGNFYLFSIDTQTGIQKKVTSYPFQTTNGFPYPNSMARDTDDNLYFSIVQDNNAVIYSVNKYGTKNWTYVIESTQNSGNAFVAINNSQVIGGDGTIYFGAFFTDSNDYYMYALNANGTKKWRRYVITLNPNLFDTNSPAINLQGNVIHSVLNDNTGSNLYSFS